VLVLVCAMARANDTSSSLTLYTALLPTANAVYALGLSKSLSSLTLHVSALDPTSGATLASIPIPSALQSVADVLVLHTESGQAVLAWLESGSLKTLTLDSELRNKPVTAKAAGKNIRRLVDVRLSKYGMLVGLQDDGAGVVLRLNNKAALERATVFADSVGWLLE
jgi:hypothetical protein